MTPVPASDTFDYLAVFFSIILGLALTEILQGFRRLIVARQRVQLYAPALSWALTLLVILAQTWWAMFELRNSGAWTFAGYAIVLLHILLLYLACSLSVPDTADKAVAMETAYFAQRRWFFLLLVGNAIASLAKDLIIGGELPERSNLLFHVAFMASALIAALTTSRLYHLILAAAAPILIAAYILTLFTRL